MDNGQQFPDDFLAASGFSAREQNNAVRNAKDKQLTSDAWNNLAQHAGKKLLESNDPGVKDENYNIQRGQLVGHGYSANSLAESSDEPGRTLPVAAHHHGDYTAHWEPGHDNMYVFHKSQDASTADPIGSVPVGHLHTEGAHIPSVNQEALEGWAENQQSNE